MLDTGFPQADAENDFQRARRHQVLAAAVHRLRGQRGSDHLVRLDQVVGRLGWRGQRQLGLQTIPVGTIIGTTGARRDFDRHFRPTTNRVRERWERVALAQRCGQPIPPIEVYRVSDLHFVSDGHHRVSIAAATGQRVIDAYVTEILTAAPADARHSQRSGSTRAKNQPDAQYPRDHHVSRPSRSEPRHKKLSAFTLQGILPSASTDQDHAADSGVMLTRQD